MSKEVTGLGLLGQLPKIYSETQEPKYTKLVKSCMGNV